MPLLTTNNAKTTKGDYLGYSTAVCYMAPADIASPGGKTVCPFAVHAGCKSSCLYSAGRGRFNSVQTARMNRTRLYYEDKDAFMALLHAEISLHIAQAERSGMIPAVRLNGTSDIPYERIPYYFNGRTYANIFDAFPETTFYDYTKTAARIGRDLPDNYDLTFSFSGALEFASHVEKALKYGARIAVVFRGGMPETYLRRPVVNGDAHDLTFLHPRGVVLGLSAKGGAKKDPSPFIVDVK